MALFSGAYSIGAASDVSEEDAQAFLEEFQELVEEIDEAGIFLHNLSISLPMFIPGFGIAWGLFSAFSTGQAWAALGVVIPEIADIPPLTVLYASPFGFMELVAYSIAMSRSFILVHMIIKKIHLKTVLIPTGIEIGIMVGLLLVGGILEIYMIEQAQETGVDILGI